MEQIKLEDLEVLRAYLKELALLSDNYEVVIKFEDNWDEQINKVHDIAIQITKYLDNKDPNKASQTRRKIDNRGADKFMIYKEFIPFFQNGIDAYQQDLGATLLRTNLLSKPIQQMTGFEFKTLLLATLTEFSDRQSL